MVKVVKELRMPQFTVKWIIEGEKIVEAASPEAAEEVMQKELVVVLTDAGRWPEDLGTRSVQGAAHPLDKQGA
jgi:hypothetical protein